MGYGAASLKMETPDVWIILRERALRRQDALRRESAVSTSRFDVDIWHMETARLILVTGGTRPNVLPG